jgi:hypothetical protein
VAAAERCRGLRSLGLLESSRTPGATIPAMKKAWMEILIFLFIVVSQGSAQLMAANEYRDYLKRLDAAVARWQVQFEAMNVEKMKVDYSLGKMLERQRDVMAKNLGLIHESIGPQLDRESLSRDIALEGSLTEAEATLGDIMHTLPANEQGVYWGRSLLPIAKEMSDFDPPFRKHVWAYADELQAKAERCSK